MVEESQTAKTMFVRTKDARVTLAVRLQHHIAILQPPNAKNARQTSTALTLLARTRRVWLENACKPGDAEAVIKMKLA